jgi:NAD(P)-dependent dehydrogenase (short-subunit alcohol dehydrogenase family)
MSSSTAMSDAHVAGGTAAKRRVAVVTGAGRGLGRVIAVGLARAGFDLVAGWSNDEEAAKETAVQATLLGARAVLVDGDVAEPKTMERMADAALSELDGVDVWVNNAGISYLSPLLSTTLDQVRRMCEVNFLGVFNGLTVAARVMAARGGGRVINMASDLGLTAAPLLAGYSATKFAVVGLSQAAAIELAPMGILVNSVCPGTVETDMVLAEERAEAVARSTTVEEVRRRLLADVPAGRLCQPEDVAQVVTFLAGPGASFITGQAICVNGGSVLH